jgi:hypothetical protein
VALRIVAVKLAAPIGPQSFLNNPITTKRITAPMTALMIVAMMPPTMTCYRLGWKHKSAWQRPT